MSAQSKTKAEKPLLTPQRRFIVDSRVRFDLPVPSDMADEDVRMHAWAMARKLCGVLSKKDVTVTIELPPDLRQ